MRQHSPNARRKARAAPNQAPFTRGECASLLQTRAAKRAPRRTKPRSHAENAPAFSKRAPQGARRAEPSFVHARRMRQPSPNARHTEPSLVHARRMRQHSPNARRQARAAPNQAPFTRGECASPPRTRAAKRAPRRTKPVHARRMRQHSPNARRKARAVRRARGPVPPTHRSGLRAGWRSQSIPGAVAGRACRGCR